MRTPPLPHALVPVLLGVLVIAAAVGAAPVRPAEAAEAFVLLLQYVGTDYALAVRDGVVVDAAEYDEMLAFTARLEGQWAELRGPDSPLEVARSLGELREIVRARGSAEEMLALTRTLVPRVVADLGLDTRPPAPPDLARGAEIYRSDCAPCHGERGAGDGPLGAALDPPPTSFLDDRMRLVSPHQAYLATRLGIPGTGMAAFRGARTDAELWDVAFHVSNLGAEGAKEEPDPGLRAALLLEDAFARVAARSFPGVVGVAAYAPDPRPASESRPPSWSAQAAADDPYPGFRPVTSGSGFAVTDDGFVLTCARLVVAPDSGKTAEIIDVEFDGNLHYRARLVGAEPTVGLAVLKTDVPFPTRPLPLGSSEAVRVGQWAIAIADPPGVEKTFAPGVIAARPERDCYQEHRTSTLLQTSIRVPAQTCGGPVVDVRGAVVGMALAEDVETSLHALPIDLTTTLYEALRAKESTRSPWIGISVLELGWRLRQTLAAAPRTGIYVEDVFEPSPASRAGVRPGDVLVAMGGERLLSVSDFQRWLYLFGIGAKVELELWRDGRTELREVTVEQRPERGQVLHSDIPGR